MSRTAAGHFSIYTHLSHTPRRVARARHHQPTQRRREPLQVVDFVTERAPLPAGPRQSDDTQFIHFNGISPSSTVCNNNFFSLVMCILSSK
jgi:hypothetical protein